MNSIKKLFAMLLVLGLVTGCGSSKDEKKEDTKKEETKKEEVKVEGMSDDIYDFQATIDGKLYTLPFAYADLAKDGWSGEEFDTKTLKPNQMTLETIKNGDKSMMMKIVNTGKDVLTFDKCNIGSFVFDTTAAKNIDFVLAKGIKMDSTKDEIVKAYGDPSSTTETHIKYEMGSYASIDFTLSEENKVINIRMENLIKQEKAAEVSDENLPAVVKKYKAPSSLGTEYTSFNVKYAGKLYQLPAPVSEFLKDGWKITRKAGEKISASDSLIAVEMMKNNKVLRTNVTNYSDKEDTVENGFVTELSYSSYNNTTDFELPGGLTKNSTQKDFEKAYGKETSKSTSSKLSTEYTYGKIWQRIVVSFSNEDGKITSLTVDHTPKEY